MSEQNIPRRRLQFRRSSSALSLFLGHASPSIYLSPVLRRTTAAWRASGSPRRSSRESQYPSSPFFLLVLLALPPPLPPPLGHLCAKIRMCCRSRFHFVAPDLGTCPGNNCHGSCLPVPAAWPMQSRGISCVLTLRGYFAPIICPVLSKKKRETKIGLASMFAVTVTSAPPGTPDATSAADDKVPHFTSRIARRRVKMSSQPRAAATVSAERPPRA